MYSFNKDDFADFMHQQFKIIVDKCMVGEESISLYKDELDDQLISNQKKSKLPNQVILHMCSYNEKSEWIVGVLCNFDNGDPLFLICLKNNTKIYEKEVEGN